MLRLLGCGDRYVAASGQGQTIKDAVTPGGVGVRHRLTLMYRGIRWVIDSVSLCDDDMLVSPQ